MAKEKLLCILKIVAVVFLLPFFAHANEDQEWASKLQAESSQMVFEDLRAKFDESEKLEQTEVKQDGILRIFVSWSMPNPLLKSYVVQAKKYGGVLVFKGLPSQSGKDGSFKLLSQKVLDLLGTDEEASIQIDDEAFEKFRIESVPVIVLSKNARKNARKNDDEVFDKIAGNIGIKYALEEFSKTGELRQEAKNLLEQVP